MDVSRTISSTQKTYISDSARESTTSGKSKEKEDKAIGLDIGFLEKAASFPSGKSSDDFEAKKLENAPTSPLCSIFSCGCEINNK